MKDFYSICNESINRLNSSDQKLLDYILKNIRTVKDQSIRELSKDCFVSTTTIVRFVQKMGFKGYREFIDMIRFTIMNENDDVVPTSFRKGDYKGDYVLNVVETLRVLSQDQMESLIEMLGKSKDIYFLGYGLSREAARYAYHLFTSIGLNCIFPTEDYEIERLSDKMSSDDVLFVISLSGDNKKTIQIMENIVSKVRPQIVSITRAGSNMIEIMSDYNFYFFNNEFSFNQVDLTSRIGMYSIIDMIVYQYVSTKNV